jgi:Zn-dependent protease with chaperone function
MTPTVATSPTAGFDPAGYEPDPALADRHRAGCGCRLHGRRLFTRLLGAGGVAAVAGCAGAPGSALAREGVDVGAPSRTAGLVPADQLEQAAAGQYRQMLQEARAKRALAPDDHPQVVRLRTIAQRIIPLSNEWNPRARNWQWEINLIGSQQINAFCMPGGKIAFYWGILEKLQLDDDEVAMIMGHEAAHALREHARERLAKTTLTRGALEIGAALFGLGDLGRMAAGLGEQLVTLRFSREDETEADLVGLELSARSGHDPRAGVSLWQKMSQASGGAPPVWLSTHPSGTDRIRHIEANIPKVAGLYERAAKPQRRFGPPPRTGAGAAPAPADARR